MVELPVQSQETALSSPLPLYIYYVRCIRSRTGNGLDARPQCQVNREDLREDLG